MRILEQDDKLDELGGVVKNIRYGHQAIGTELDVHAQLLDKTGADVSIVDL